MRKQHRHHRFYQDQARSLRYSFSLAKSNSNLDMFLPHRTSWKTQPLPRWLVQAQKEKARLPSLHHYKCRQ
uniref:Uncharacterized protein n=1 Tax=Nelumbo nucifera TaxID=4432 RepID=A0A822YWK7_NELNU|nr:TPA_asm: hypothetical protein HUJ06_007723 [Nelumbo nucifera]